MSYNFFKKYIIQIPFYIKIFFIKKNTVFFLDNLRFKSIKTNLKILIVKNKPYIIVTQLPVNKFFKKKRKNYLKFLQKFLLMSIKQIIYSLSKIFQKKLQLFGIGFRASILNKSLFNILFLKLGYSHNVFIRIPKNLIINCIKTTKILVFGKNYQKLNEFVALVQSCKTPDPYKGKGILLNQQKTLLKIGKKV